MLQPAPHRKCQPVRTSMARTGGRGGIGGIVSTFILNFPANWNLKYNRVLIYLYLILSFHHCGNLCCSNPDRPPLNSRHFRKVAMGTCPEHHRHDCGFVTRTYLCGGVPKCLQRERARGRFVPEANKQFNALDSTTNCCDAQGFLCKEIYYSDALSLSE